MGKKAWVTDLEVAQFIKAEKTGWNDPVQDRGDIRETGHTVTHKEVQFS